MRKKKKITIAGLMIILITLLSLSPKLVIAQSGAFFKRTLTFGEASNAEFVFVVNGNRDPYYTTEVLVEIGSDESDTALPGTSTSLVFELHRISLPAHNEIIATPIVGGPPSTTSVFSSKSVSLSTQDVSGSHSTAITRQFQLSITDITGAETTTDEEWKLEVRSLPISATDPQYRVIASIITSHEEYKSLIPVGTGGAGNVEAQVSVTPSGNTVTFTATVSGAPAGATHHWTPEGDAVAGSGTTSADGLSLNYNLESCSNNCCCRNITYKFEVKQGTTVLASNRGVYLQKSLSGCGDGVACPLCPSNYFDHLVVVEVPHWDGPWPPWPPEPCWQCPPDWGIEVPEDMIRKFVLIRPIDEKGNLLGSGLADEIKYELKDAKAVGPLFDNQNGEYIQAVEYKKGAEPVISATVRNISSKKIAIEKPVKPSVLPWVLLAVSVIVNFAFLQRVTRKRA